MGPPTRSDPSPGACASCGAALVGPYCHACGEAVRDPGRETVPRYAATAVAAVFSVDGRWPRAARRLVFEPGGLAADWVAGRRRATPGPWSLFVVANVLYFLVTSALGAGLLWTPLARQVGGTPWGAFAERLAGARAAALGLPIDDFAVLYDAHATTVSKLLIVALVPMFAVVLWALHRRREPRALPHLVLATHFVAYWALVPALVVPLTTETLMSFLIHVVGLPLEWLAGDPILATVVILSGALWLLGAERRVYAVRNRAGRLVRVAIAAFLFLALVIFPYRALEFAVTWWTL